MHIHFKCYHLITYVWLSTIATRVIRQQLLSFLLCFEGISATCAVHFDFSYSFNRCLFVVSLSFFLPFLYLCSITRRARAKKVQILFDSFLELAHQTVAQFSISSRLYDVCILFGLCDYREMTNFTVLMFDLQSNCQLTKTMSKLNQVWSQTHPIFDDIIQSKISTKKNRN